MSPGGLICTHCGRLVGAGEKHPDWCPDAITLPPGADSPDVWLEGYAEGFQAAKTNVGPELLDLYRARLRKIIQAARETISPHHHSGRLAHAVVDVVERQAERDSLL